MTSTMRLAEFVVSTREVPPGVMFGMQDALIDTLGCALAGSREAMAILAYRHVEASAVQAATLWGHEHKARPADAAFANAVAGHVLDFDDTLASLRGHSSITTVPVAIAIGEAKHASGAQVLTALALGLEVAGKLGRAFGNEHYLHGWHSTATVGIFAATAVAAHLLRQDAATLCRAWGIAAAQTGGLVRNFGTMAKAVQVGYAARAAVDAALLAGAGVTADPQVFDGPHGVLEAYHAGGDLGEVLRRLGSPWEVLDPGLIVKRWPCCYCCHRAIGGLERMLGELSIDRRDVVGVTVGFPPGSDEPLIYTDPATALEGKFSIEYPIAALLLDGDVTLGSFTDEMVRRPEAREMMKRIRRAPVPDQGTFSGTVGYNDLEVTTSRGRWMRRIDKAPGSLAWPLTPAERRRKFLDCASLVMARSSAGELLETIEHFAALEDVGELTSRLPLDDTATDIVAERTR